MVDAAFQDLIDYYIPDVLKYLRFSAKAKSTNKDREITMWELGNLVNAVGRLTRSIDALPEIFAPGQVMPKPGGAKPGSEEVPMPEEEGAGEAEAGAGAVSVEEPEHIEGLTEELAIKLHQYVTRQYV